MIFCTVSTANNLHRAKVMASSVKKWMTGVTLVLCLVEETVHPAAEACPYFDQVLLAKDAGVKHFHELMYKSFIAEGAIAMKASVMKYVLLHYPEETYLVYLDTDLKVYHPFYHLIPLLDWHPVLITPHRIEVHQDPLGYLHHGIYNTGIVAVKRSEETDRFLDWWEARLCSHCYFDAPFFVDQKWMDHAPALFDVLLWKHPGYNMAAWNLHETSRRIARLESQVYWLENQEPLYCFHFSGMQGMLQHCMSHSVPDPCNPLYSMYEEYVDELKDAGQETLAGEPWSYDVHLDGSYVDPGERRFYRSLMDTYGSMGINPFEKKEKGIT